MGSFKSFLDIVFTPITFIAHAQLIFNAWLLRQFVLANLFQRVIMALFAYLRKITSCDIASLVVWLINLGSDVWAITALSIAARDYGKSLDSEHEVFLIWAMCLLLHLGGPDNICAFSLYDHDMWQTRFIGFVLQFLVAFYLLFKSWGKTYLLLAASPLFIAGSLKYGEKIWVLRSLTINRFKKSLRLEELRRQHLAEDFNGDGDGNVLLVADFLFKRLKFFFAGIKLPIREGGRGRELILRLNSPKLAFRTVELQLGLLHDMLYTKAIMMYTKLGISIRCISFLASIFSLVTFWCVGQAYNLFDLLVTFVLLWGAVGMEFVSLISLITSDWTKIWLLRQPKSELPLFNKLVGELSQVEGKRWSRKITRFNLIRFCFLYAKLLNMVPSLQLKSDVLQVLLDVLQVLSQNLLHFHPRQVIERLVSQQNIDAELLVLIFNHLEDRLGMISNNLNDSEICKKLLNYRGDFVLQKVNCLEDLRWSTVAVEFDHSLLLWHIATDLCYYDDADERSSGVDGNTLKKYSKISKCLSDYMLYLLDMHTDSLPKHTDKRRYKEVSDECIKFFKTKRVKKREKAYEELLQHQQQGQRNSILVDGCRLAAQLQSLKPPNMENWGCKEKWEMMNMVWVELLTYAAAHCGWEQHAKHLRYGGELLTHVCLLMANLSLSPQYYS